MDLESACMRELVGFHPEEAYLWLEIVKTV